MVMARNGSAQEIEGDCADSGDHGVERDRKGEEMIFAQVNRGPRDNREPEEKIHVCPEDCGIDTRDEMDEMMMIDPVDRDNDEAEHVGRKRRPHTNE